MSESAPWIMFIGGFSLAVIGVALMIRRDSASIKNIPALIGAKNGDIGKLQNEMKAVFTTQNKHEANLLNLTNRADAFAVLLNEFESKIQFVENERIGALTKRCEQILPSVLEVNQKVNELISENERVCKSFSLDIDILKQRANDFDDSAKAEPFEISLIVRDGDEYDKKKQKKALLEAREASRAAKEVLKKTAKQVRELSQ